MASVIAHAIGVDTFAPGDVLPIAHHASDDRELEILSHGGSLYLVAAEGRKLWLVAVLEAPEHARVRIGDRRKPGWYALANIQPVTDLAPLRRRLRIGKLHAPRTLTSGEEAAIRALLGDDDAPIHAAADLADAPVLDGPPLARAAAHLAGGRVDAAIAAMAEAWRAARSVELADVIERATRLMRGHDRPLLDRYDRADPQPWLAALDAGGEAAYPQLLLSLAVGSGIDDRLARLAAQPHDPRIARRVAALITELSWDLLDVAFALVHDTGDARAIADAHARTSELVDRPRSYVAPRAVATADPRVDVAAIDAALAPLEAAAGDTERALVDAIGESWRDDGPRLVYADWLLERGHARGEYLALACEGKLSPAKARRRALLEDVPYLFGAIDDIALSFRRVRDRGLDRTLSIAAGASPPKLAGAARSPLVRLLVELDVIGTPMPDRLPAFAALVRAMPRLERIGGLERDVAVKLQLEGFVWRGEQLVRR